MKIEYFILAETIEWDDALKQFRGTKMVPSSIRLLNPSPGSLATMLTFQFGVAVSGLDAGSNVSAMIEITHVKGKKWGKLGEKEATLGPTASYWIYIGSLTFPPIHEGVFKLRLTVRSGDKSQRTVKKINVKFTPAN